jgi:hypothetical protein
MCLSGANLSFFFGDENWIFKSIYGVDFDVEAELVLFVR